MTSSSTTRVLTAVFLTALITLNGCQHVQTGSVQARPTEHILDKKLPAPTQLTAKQTPGVVEKQFRTDTGATALTPRVEISQKLHLSPETRESLRIKFDLSDWPEKIRRRARIWVAVSASESITTEGPLGVTFKQNGVGMSTDLNSTYKLDDSIIMGCDYAFADGEVIVEVDCRARPRAVDCTAGAIVYVPAEL